MDVQLQRLNQYRIALIATSVTATMLAAAFYSGKASADDPEVAPGGLIQEIVVTATRRDTSVQNVDFNLSAYPGSQLEQQRIVDQVGLAKTVPGLIAVDQGNRNAPLLIMRGANLDTLTAGELYQNSGETVSTFYGETPLYFDPLLIDVNRVEVLRGPQGTLYGGRSLGGSVRYMPALPDTQNLSVDVHGRGYAIDESDGGGFLGDITLNAPIIEDVLAFRGSIGYLNEDGFIDYTGVLQDPGTSDPEDPNDVRTVKDANDQKVSQLRLALLWNISDNWSSTLAYTHQTREFGARQVNTKDSYDTGEYEAAYRYLEPNERKNDIFNLMFNGNVGFADFVSTTSYTKFTEDGQRDQTDFWYDFYANLDFDFGDPFTVLSRDIEAWDELSAYTSEDIEEKIFTQEFRLISKTDTNLQWLAGLFYQKIDNDNSTTETLPGLSDWWNTNIAGAPDEEFLTDDLEDIGFIGTGDNEFEEIAVYGQLGYNFTEAWQATVGGRYFKTDQDLTICEWYEPVKGDTALGGSFFACEDGGGKADESIFMFNTSYDFSDAAKSYFTVSEGYGTGGENPFITCNGNDINPPGCIAPGEKDVEPEKVTNYELGARTTWFDSTLRLNAALYYMDWESIQVDGASSEDPSIIITRNGGKATTRGLEAELAYLLGDHWSFSLGYAYTKARFEEDLDVGSVYAFDIIEKGDRLPGSPEHQGNLYVGFDYPISGGLRVKADWLTTAQSDVLTKAGVGGSDCCREDGEALSGFAVHNLGLGLAGDRWEARLFADNLSNKYAETGLRGDLFYVQGNGFGIDNNWGSNPKTLRTYHKNMIRPRTIGLDLRWFFNAN